MGTRGSGIWVDVSGKGVDFAATVSLRMEEMLDVDRRRVFPGDERLGFADNGGEWANVVLAVLFWRLIQG